MKAGADKTVAEAVVEQVTRGRTQEAILLRDAGKTEEANKLLMQNAAEINAFVEIGARRLAASAGPGRAVLGDGLSPCAGLPLADGPTAQGAAQPGKHRRRLRHALLRMAVIPEVAQRPSGTRVEHAVFHAGLDPGSELCSGRDDRMA